MSVSAVPGNLRPSAIDERSRKIGAYLQAVARYGAITVAGFSCIVLAGWVLSIPELTGLAPKQASTSVVTAICFLFSSIAIFQDSRPRQGTRQFWLASMLTALVLAIGCYDIATYMHGSATAGYLLGPHLGRMAPATATGFVLLALMLMAGAWARGYVQGALAVVGLMLSMTDLICHIYGAEALYALAPFAAMALLTAIFFVVLFISVLLGAPDRGWIKYLAGTGSGPATARVLLPAIVVIPFALSWLLVEADRTEAFAPAFGFAILAVATTFVLGTILCLTSAWLSRSDKALRQSNADLEESENTARGIIDTALDAFVQMDEAGTIIDWNPQAEAVFGWSRAEATGQILAELIIPGDLRESYNAEIAEFLRTAETSALGVRLERDALSKDGRQLRIDLALTALARRDGYVFNAFMRDITEKLATESRLRQAQKMDAVGNLTGGIAHDFNNLLAVIVGNLDEVQLMAPQDSEIAELAGMALRAALRGADLTQRLLAFARQQPLQPRRVSLNALLADHAKLLSRTLGGAITLELDFAADTWPIVADPAQLEAAVLNLAANAREAMPDGGKITITTANCRVDAALAEQTGDLKPGDYAVVEVLDNGLGMTPDVVSHIFEPFYTTKERGKGTGLGLAMVFGFVKQSNGHVSVYSEPGVGTTFRLYLPRISINGEDIAPAAASSISCGHGEKVLVVEDNPDLRKLVVRQLQSLDYRTLEAGDVGGALAILHREPVDLVFSDVVLPGGRDGVELAREILAHWPDSQVVLTSGFADSRAREKFGKFAESVQLLRKPYRKDNLAEAVRSALDARFQKARAAGQTFGSTEPAAAPT